MASRTFSATSFLLLLLLNSLLFALVSAGAGCPPPPKPKPKPTPKPCPPPSAYGKCPKDTLKLGVCADLLGLISVEVGKPPKEPCCSLLEGLADVEAAVCLCTAIKANVLGINLNVPVDLTLLLNYCGKSVPEGFKCA